MAVSQSISLTQGTQSIANNTTQVTFKWTSTQTGESWNGYTKTAYYYVSINGGAETKYSVSYTLPKSNTTTIVSKTFTVTHNGDGTGKISVRTWMDTGISAGVVEKSASLTLKTIPRQASLTDAPNFNDEESPTISYSNPAGNNVTTLQACMANESGTIIYCAYRDISKTGTSYTFSLTDEERAALRNACKSANSMNIKFYIKTVLGGNTFYSSLIKKISIINATPTFENSNISYFDSSSVVDITNDNQMIVKGKSILSAECTAATAKKGASISKYTFTLNGVTKEISSVGLVDFGTINSSSDLILSAFATDSRGNKSKTVSITVKCYDYFSPTISKFNVYRANSDGTSNVNGTYLKCDYIENYASVNSTNETVVTAHYNGESATCSDGTVLINLNGDTGITYNVNLQISDKYGGHSSTSRVTVFGSSRILNITKDGTGIALGKMAEKSNLFECKHKAQFDDSVTVPDNGGPVINGYSVGTLGIGTGIESGTDLDNCQTPGVYIVASADIASSLSNTPITNAGFKLIVEYFSGKNYIKQTVVLRKQSYTSFVRIFDNYANPKWGEWQRIDPNGIISNITQLTIGSNQYYTSSSPSFGINMSNSDIINLNALYFRDASDSAGEAINFYRSDGYWDTLYASGGSLKFHPNRATDTNLNGYRIYDSSYLQMRRGKCTLSSSGSGVTITFTELPGVPTVMLTPLTTTEGVIAGKVTNVTSTGFTAIIGGSAVSSAQFAYLAVYYG